MSLLAVWDFLLIALVIFPLTTGGVWIRRPGLFLELSDLGIPVLIVAIVGGVIHFGFGGNLGKSYSVTFCRRLWARWQNAVEQQPALVLGGASFGVGVLWAAASLLRHWNLGSNAYDLGIFTNAIWNLTHGHGYVSSIKDGINLFADHQSPLFWALAPVFWLVPRPETLLVVQAFGLAAGGPALFFLARQVLGKGHWLEAALPLLYWMYPSFRYANAFDFHPEVLMLPLFLWGIVGIQSRRFGLAGALAFAAALGAKESAGPLAFGIGVAWALGAGPAGERARLRRIGVGVALAGLAVFLFDTRVAPSLAGATGGYAYQGLFADVFQPSVFLGRVFAASRLKFLFWTLAPLGFLPLIGGRVMFAALPAYLMLFLSAGDHRVNPIYHYGIEPGTILFWAMPAAVLAVESRWPERRGALAAWLVFWSLAAFGRSDLVRIRENWPTEHARWVRSEVVPCIAPEIPLAATSSLVPQLSTRPWVQRLPEYRRQTPADRAATGPSLSVAGYTPGPHTGEPLECVVDDAAAGAWPMSAEERARIVTSELPAAGYSPVYSCGELQIWSRAGAACLRCQPPCVTK